MTVAKRLIEDEMSSDEKKQKLLNIASKIDAVISDIDVDYYDTELKAAIEQLKSSSAAFRQASEL